MKPDVIVSWPRNCDYPLWRLFMQTNRDRFGEVIIIITETHQGPNFSEYLKTVFKPPLYRIAHSPMVYGGDDWRNIAVNFALETYSRSEWVWFTEQDFFVTSASWFEAIDELAKNHDAIGVRDGDRIHPCSLLVSRDFTYRTRLDFGVGEGLDHFGKFTKDLAALGARFAFVDRYYEHMAGLSHNWRLVCDGEPANYKPEEFYRYLSQCLDAPIERSPEWVKIAEKTITARLSQGKIEA